ncbi:MAG: nuclear transport factor 2 family protein [Bacteroidetes bacterium]|nr:MAG: nuclear transport factor 2 family protein [Bacteroidota bacterium]
MQNLKEQIILNEEKLLVAIKSNDVEILDNLLHQDLLFNLPNGQTVSKEMDMQTYCSGNMTVHEISASQQQINLIGDTAVVSVKIKIDGKYFEQVLNGTFSYIRVWKLFDQQWKIIAGSCVQV